MLCIELLKISYPFGCYVSFTLHFSGMYDLQTMVSADNGSQALLSKDILDYTVKIRTLMASSLSLILLWMFSKDVLGLLHLNFMV